MKTPKLLVKLLFLFFLFFSLKTVDAQTDVLRAASSLTTITSLRLYEHHSPAIAGGSGADGKQSGYDFVNNTYYSSFDHSSFTGWKNGEESNIDMVEHNGHATSGGDFGFTSGISTLWAGAIKGNSLTKYMIAPATFDYLNASDASEIFNVYNEDSATLNIEHVSINDIYLARVRGSNLYVAIKIIDVVNDSNSWSFQDQYFDFEYKYGTYQSSEIDEQLAEDFSMYPNPVTSTLTINGVNFTDESKIKIIDLTGKLLLEVPVKSSSTRINLDQLAAGPYLLEWDLDHGKTIKKKLIKK